MARAGGGPAVEGLLPAVAGLELASGGGTAKPATLSPPDEPPERADADANEGGGKRCAGVRGARSPASVEPKCRAGGGPSPACAGACCSVRVGEKAPLAVASKAEDAAAAAAASFVGDRARAGAVRGLNPGDEEDDSATAAVEGTDSLL